jgi:hypothetical protein
LVKFFATAFSMATWGTAFGETSREERQGDKLRVERQASGWEGNEPKNVEGASRERQAEGDGGEAGRG